jgi:hypothetical protein
LSIGKAAILSSKLHTIDEMITLKHRERIFSVWVKEDENGWSPEFLNGRVNTNSTPAGNSSNRETMGVGNPINTEATKEETDEAQDNTEKPKESEQRLFGSGNEINNVFFCFQSNGDAGTAKNKTQTRKKRENRRRQGHEGDSQLQNETGKDCESANCRSRKRRREGDLTAHQIDLNGSPICSVNSTSGEQVLEDLEDGEVVPNSLASETGNEVVHETISVLGAGSNVKEMEETVKICKKVGLNLTGFEDQILESLRMDKENTVNQ